MLRSFAGEQGHSLAEEYMKEGGDFWKQTAAQTDSYIKELAAQGVDVSELVERVNRHRNSIAGDKLAVLKAKYGANSRQYKDAKMWSDWSNAYMNSQKGLQTLLAEQTAANPSSGYSPTGALTLLMGEISQGLTEFMGGLLMNFTPESADQSIIDFVTRNASGPAEKEWMIQRMHEKADPFVMAGLLTGAVYAAPAAGVYGVAGTALNTTLYSLKDDASAQGAMMTAGMGMVTGGLSSSNMIINAGVNATGSILQQSLVSNKLSLIDTGLSVMLGVGKDALSKGMSSVFESGYAVSKGLIDFTKFTAKTAVFQGFNTSKSLMLNWYNNTYDAQKDRPR